MAPNPFVTVLLPVALAVIMLALGLSLTIDDFRRVIRYPKAVAIGLACQALILPAVAFAIARAFALSPELAVGLMVLAASPGGPVANAFSYLAKGDVALNITLTAVNSALSLITLPLIVNLALAHFLGEDRSIPLQVEHVVAVIVIVLVPVAIGMSIRSKRPVTADRLHGLSRALAAVFLAIVLCTVLVLERHNLPSYVRQVGLAALTFNLASLTIGYTVPRIARLAHRQAVAIGMEIGIHNVALAVTVASNPRVLGNMTMAIPAAIYSLIMVVTAAAFSVLLSRSRIARSPGV